MNVSFGGFLAGNVQHLAELRRRLQEERRFADARFAGEQDERARNDPAAEDPVELADAGRQTRNRFAFKRSQRDGRAGLARMLKADG